MSTCPHPRPSSTRGCPRCGAPLTVALRDILARQYPPGPVEPKAG